MIDGFIDAHMSLRAHRTVVLVSLWSSEQALVRFTSSAHHTDLARWARDEKMQVWSGVFRLKGTSSLTRTRVGEAQQWVPDAI
jgi:heme-degrading monooxygenase HmoA